MIVKLYENLKTELPDGFRQAEEKVYFGAKAADNYFKEKNETAEIMTILTDTPLENTKAAEHIAAYQKVYARMVPGFVMGELRLNSTLGHNVAIMTYKSNAPEKNMFNILAVTSLDEKELLILLTCDMANAINNMGRFLKILDSLEFSI